jgi:hypothetical protein
MSTYQGEGRAPLIGRPFSQPKSSMIQVRFVMPGPDWWRTCEFCLRVLPTRRAFKNHEKKRLKTGLCQRPKDSPFAHVRRSA